MSKHNTTTSSSSSVMNIASMPKKEFKLKFLVAGDYAVGKTSIVRRYVHGKFTPNYKMTIGVDYSQKTIVWDPTTTVHVELWDVAGNEKFRCVTRVYYKYAVGAAVVFDLTRMETLKMAKHWLDDIRENVTMPDGSEVPVVLLANKGDLDPGYVPVDKITQFCHENNIQAWCATSAKVDVNIDKCIVYLIETALKANVQTDTVDQPIKLHVKPRNVKNKGNNAKCCQ